MIQLYIVYDAGDNSDRSLVAFGDRDKESKRRELTVRSWDIFLRRNSDSFITHLEDLISFGINPTQIERLREERRVDIDSACGKLALLTVESYLKRDPNWTDSDIRVIPAQTLSSHDLLSICADLEKSE